VSARQRNRPDVGEVTATLGIQYARAPRFAHPVAVEEWTALGAFGPAAPQPERPLGLLVFGGPGATDEECLYLNVWAPGGEGKPVIVFIHGGGFTVGSASAGISNGARLARAADAVVVSINYRLGSLGWLFHPEIDGGNRGLFDQRAALEWVRDNVASFGGDAARVTVMGQSAGALSIIDLLGMPGAEGLFARAIVQSPPMVDAAHDPELGVRWTEALRARVDLRSASADEIVAAHETLLAGNEFRGTRGGALPMRDPWSIPWTPREKPDASRGVDVLIGTTGDEGTFFFRAAGRNVDPDDAELARIVGHLAGVTDPAALIAAYGPGPNADVLARVATAAMVEVPAAPGPARAPHRGRACIATGSSTVRRARASAPCTRSTCRSSSAASTTTRLRPRCPAPTTPRVRPRTHCNRSSAPSCTETSSTGHRCLPTAVRRRSPCSAATRRSGTRPRLSRGCAAERARGSGCTRPRGALTCRRRTLIRRSRGGCGGTNYGKQGVTGQAFARAARRCGGRNAASILPWPPPGGSLQDASAKSRASPLRPRVRRPARPWSPSFTP
jgi:para-nitrobenzyl esterase